MTANESLSLDVLKLALERGEKVDIGNSQANVFNADIEANVYAKTSYVAYKDTNKYFIEEILIDTDNDLTEGKLHEYDSFSELINGIQAIDWSNGQCYVEMPSMDDANPFDITFESYDVFGNRLANLNESKTDTKSDFCCICGEPIEGYGNNAAPYKEGRCCDACNYKFVIPARLADLQTYLGSDQQD